MYQYVFGGVIFGFKHMTTHGKQQQTEIQRALHLNPVFCYLFSKKLDKKILIILSHSYVGSWQEVSMLDQRKLWMCMFLTGSTGEKTLVSMFYGELKFKKMWGGLLTPFWRMCPVSSFHRNEWSTMEDSFFLHPWVEQLPWLCLKVRKST